MTEATDTVLVLTRCRTDDAGHVFGLRGGDILRAVDGEPWQGSANALKRRMARQTDPVALQFQRGDVVFAILTTQADLGFWDSKPRPETLPPVPKLGGNLGLWEIVARPCGAHELFPLGRSWLAAILPPLWLVQARIWTGLALFVAALAITLPAGPIMAGLVWVAAGLHLWQLGPDHQRVALQMQGFGRRGRIAARNEAEAVATWTALHPKARFRFASPVRAESLQSELG